MTTTVDDLAPAVAELDRARRIGWARAYAAERRVAELEQDVDELVDVVEVVAADKDAILRLAHLRHAAEARAVFDLLLDWLESGAADDHTFEAMIALLERLADHHDDELANSTADEIRRRYLDRKARP